MKILCVWGMHNYGNPLRGVSYEYSNFLPSLRKLGHELIFFESLDKSFYQDFGDLNEKLLKTVVTEKPDIILCVLLGYEVWLETLKLILNNTNAILINWSTDDSWKYEQFSRHISPLFHLYATTYPDAINKAKRDGFHNFFLTQWAASSVSLQEPLPAAKCQHNVTFVGSAYGNRPQWISELKQQGIHVDCFGYGWPNGPIPAEEIPNIIRGSIISLNFGDSGIVMKGIVPHRSRQIKARVFEVPGAGGFLLTEHADRIDDFYQVGKEIVTYDSIADLAEKIRFYLNQPDRRDHIAQAGFQRTKQEHIYEMRFKALFESIPKQAVSDTSNAAVLDMFKSIRKSHQTRYFLKIIRQLLLFPCVMIWGNVRGRRAARRLLFELSWRFFGKRTFSVVGWPGRLFYKES